MFNVCPRCGEYAVEKTIDSSGPFAVCPCCGYRHPFLQLPLFIITGASGTGKTTVCLTLAPRLRECVCLESDILWRSEFATPEDNYRSYRDMWLRMAKNIGQSGRPVVLFGSAVPAQFESLPERRYFTTLHYLALVCEEDALTEQLQHRPAWRLSASPEFLERMRGFNRWLREHATTAEPAMTLLDTTHITTAALSAAVAEWIRAQLPER